jgi:hypothetical protein
VNLEEYTFALGKLMVNLHSLEFALRAFLWNREGGSSWRFLDGLRQGDTVPENAFTSYDTLGQLIAKYNAFVAPLSSNLCVDSDLVSLRDALAHGWVASNAPEPPLRLLKFGKPSGGTATVMHSILMEEGWLAAQTTRIRIETEKITAAE